VCNPSEALVFVELYDDTTLRTASLVFIVNICARKSPLSVFKGMNSTANYIDRSWGKGLKEKIYFLLQTPT
jgi:hypothetical protein